MLRLRARYLLPIDQPPILNGVLTIDGSRIVAIEPYSNSSHAAKSDVIDLGDVAILPGLVNAHTHLEFSHLQQPLGTRGMVFPEWIAAVVRNRQSVGADALTNPILAGIQESLTCGVTTVGDIAQRSPIGIDAALELQSFLELRSPMQSGIDAAVTLATQAIEDLQSTEPRSLYQLGLSPHAPYTVHIELLKQLVALSSRHSVPLAMHLAESPEELQYLRDQSGPFCELMENRGVFDSTAILPHATPLEYLQMLATASRALVIHGNYLTDSELDFLAKRSDRMSLVYCPRTHAYFQHALYPLHAALRRGIPVALGTDSRASNPDLNLLEEIRSVVQRDGVSPQTALTMGTLNGAKALGREESIGSLTVGKLANLAVLRTSSPSDAEPYESCLHSDSRAVATVVRGQIVWSELEELPAISTTTGSS
ncbi:MAG: amidohydrolase family protein [Planctomycetota bacterium]|nr:amidohydrolase family protein [Planctomycetota bacterium]